MVVTIHDVARRAGVSVKTVSRAINDHADVSVRTRATVRDAVQELGFRPNAVARGLRKGSTGLIALLVPDIVDPHYAEFACQLQTQASADGFLPVLSSHDDDPAIALASLRSFVAHRVDGLIWITEAVADEAVAELVGARLPTVLMGPAPDGIDHIRAPRFVPDATGYGRATRAAVAHLVALGHRDLVYLAESLVLPSVRERIAGFRGAVAGYGLPPGAGLVWTDPLLPRHKLEGGLRAMHRLLDAGHRPTAVCASSDMVAIGALRALHERGLRVPTDVSLVGCNDVGQASYTAPPLTTIHTPYRHSSATALDLLRYLMDRTGRVEPVGTEGYSLVIRGSTGPPLDTTPHPSAGGQPP